MKQITLKVNGIKIKIQARAITRQGNLQGYQVKINEKRYFYGVLTYRQAIDKAYVAYVKETNGVNNVKK